MPNFIEQQWKKYCERLKSSAEYYAGEDSAKRDRFLAEAKSFIASNQADDYFALLKITAAGRELILTWRENSPLIDETEPFSDSTNVR